MPTGFVGTTIYDYRIALGSATPMGSLTNIETLIGYPPQTQPVAFYPVRTRVLSGREYGDGAVNHTWAFNEGVPIDKVGTILNTFFGGGTTGTVSAFVTINTRLHPSGTYGRFTGWMALPLPGDDYTYDRTFARDFQLRFLGLTRL